MLGVTDEAEFGGVKGTLRSGDALMLFTDGLVEAAGRDITEGIDRLAGAADAWAGTGFQGAAWLLIEAVAKSGRSLTELMDAMPSSVTTPEIRFQVDEPRKFAIVEEVLERLSSGGAEVDRTDGARVRTADGWWLLRASNTQDVLVARAEARDQAGLDRLMAQVDEQLQQSGVERSESAH